VQVVCTIAGLDNPFITRLASAVSDAFLRSKASTMSLGLFCPGAMAYVQGFALEAIAPFRYEQF
jgi:hypothetical protein